MMVEKWESESSVELADHKIFKIRQDIRRSPRTGNKHPFVVLEAGDWINVIPVTPAGKVVMIHQFRHGTAEITLEIPGGMVDAEDGDPAVAARRELLEETGYAVDELVHLGTSAPNPAFLNNHIHTYLALNARQVAQPVFDGAEDIAVKEVALDHLSDLVRGGQITHALVIVAFYFFHQYQEQNPDWFESMIFHAG
ncbi:MAG: NUDIX hydrolase [Anaerolineae bacterium]